MANWSGITATLSALVRPSTLRPSLVVPSIAQLDWLQLRSHAHIDAVVIDKDNCIARPNDDTLANDDGLRTAWDELLRVFGPERVLVVSNSAGDLRKDPLLIQAETVSRNLSVPVLVHANPKPAYNCAKQIAAHFLPPTASSSSSSSTEKSQPGTSVVFSPLAKACARQSRTKRAIAAPEGATATTGTSRPFRVLVIGDRLATDMILSSRLSSLSLPLTVPTPMLPSLGTASASPASTFSRLVSRLKPTPKLTVGRPGQRIEAIGVLTTTLWGREGAGTTLMRFGEKAAVRGLEWRMERARRTRKRSVSGALAKEQEDVEWRRYTLGWEAEQQQRQYAAATAAIEAPSRPPLLSATDELSHPTTARQPVTQSLSETLSTIPARISTATSSLLTLPSRIPDLASSFLHSLPQRVHDLTTRIFLSFLRMLERRGPGAVRILEGGLKRLVDIYRPPNEGAMSTALVSKNSRNGNDGLPRFEVVERAVDGLEQRWDEAGRTLDRLRGRVGVVTGRAAEQAEAVRRRFASRAETGPSSRL